MDDERWWASLEQERCRRTPSFGRGLNGKRSEYLRVKPVEELHRLAVEAISTVDVVKNRQWLEDLADGTPDLRLVVDEEAG